MKSSATPKELPRIEIVQNWATAHVEEIWMDALLSIHILQLYLPAHTTLRQASSALRLCFPGPLSTILLDRHGVHPLYPKLVFLLLTL